MRSRILQRINEVALSGLCTGCGTCVGICPERVLRVEMTQGGTYVPKIAQSDCEECFLCEEVCTVNNDNIKELNQFIFHKMPDNRLIGNFISCYGGYSTDSAIRWSATSGGLITSLLVLLLQNELIDGALLTRIDKYNPLQAEPFIARTEKDILSAMGAKYVPVPLNQLLNQVLSEDGTFAVVGLPCHIQAIRRAELNVKDLRDRMVYHFGLTCSHTLTHHGVEYILHNMGVSVDRIVKLEYRGGGWPGGIKVLLRDGQQRFLPNQASLWSEVFGAYFFVPFCCTVCHDHLNEFADISFGDAWLPDIRKRDKIGTSIAITRTRTGEHLLKAAASNGEIEVFALSCEDVIQSQLWPLLFKKRNIKARLRFLDLFGRPVPKSLKENMDTFVDITSRDYVAAAIPYANALVSRNALLRNVLERTPPRILTLYRQKFKQWLLHDHEQAVKNAKRP